MFCYPVKILRQRIHLVIKGAIGQLLGLLDKLMIPGALRQLNQAGTYSAAMFAQPFNLITDGRDPDQLHSVLLLDLRDERWTLACIFDQDHAWSIFPNEPPSLWAKF